MKKFISKVKKSCRNFINGKAAFSLVELIVVIAIMAVMAAVLAPALLGYVERSRAQKDDSAMGEVTNAIQLSLADQNVYDELLQYSVKDNYSCYCDGDTSTNTNANKITTKEPDLWLFGDDARLLDETVYKPAGKMRGATVTFKPNGKAEYILKDGIVNKIGDDTTKKGSLAGKTLADCPELYNRLRSTVGDTIAVSSQTYRNSDYTIFVSMSTTGGNQADKQDAIKVYGQYNGTNLAEVAAPVAGAGQGAPSGGSGGSEQPGGNEPIIPSTPIVEGSVEFVGTTLSWEEVKKDENGQLYGYNASQITDTTIGNEAFKNCTDIVSITIPSTVKAIGNSAFEYSGLMGDVTIPNSVTTIGANAFNMCVAMESITLPNSLTRIERGLLTSCEGLTEITIPNTVTYIGEKAFLGCSYIEEFNIPHNVNYIGKNAFLDCYKLTKFNYDGTKSEWDDIEKDNSIFPITHSIGSMQFNCTDYTETIQLG